MSIVLAGLLALETVPMRHSDDINFQNFAAMRVSGLDRKIGRELRKLPLIIGDSGFVSDLPSNKRRIWVIGVVKIIPLIPRQINVLTSLTTYVGRRKRFFDVRGLAINNNVLSEIHSYIGRGSRSGIVKRETNRQKAIIVAGKGSVALDGIFNRYISPKLLEANVASNVVSSPSFAESGPDQRHANQAQAHTDKRCNPHYFCPERRAALRYKIGIVSAVIVLLLTFFGWCAWFSIRLFDRGALILGLGYLVASIFGLIGVGLSGLLFIGSLVA